MATLAFGSFAMANTVDVETVEAVSVESVDCDSVYRTVRDAYLADGYSRKDAVIAATAAYSRCANPAPASICAD